MNKDLALKLTDKAEEIAKHYSNPTRAFNGNKETFELEEIVPLSEYTAIAIYNKSSGKKALAFLYWVSMGYWGYFFPKESHIFGMEKLRTHLQKIEEHNFKQNKPTTGTEPTQPLKTKEA